jgi:2-phosphoglycerate kinase
MCFHSAATLIDEFRAQAELVCHAVQACVKRSRDEGIHLVLEGNHLLPEYIHALSDQTPVMLRATPTQIAERLIGPTHRTRAITATDSAHIVAIQDFIMREAIRWDIPIIDNNDRDQAADAILRIAGCDQ